MSKVYKSPDIYHNMDQYASEEGGGYSVAPYAYSMLFHKIKLELAEIFNAGEIEKFDFASIIDLVSQPRYNGYNYDYNVDDAFELVGDFFSSLEAICGNVFSIESEDMNGYQDSDEYASTYFAAELEDCCEISLDFDFVFNANLDLDRINQIMNDYNKNQTRHLPSHITNKSQFCISLSIVLEPLYYIDLDLIILINFIIALKKEGVFDNENVD